MTAGVLALAMAAMASLPDPNGIICIPWLGRGVLVYIGL